MCLGVPCRVTAVVDLDKGLVEVANDGRSARTVSIQMLQQAGEPVDVGHWVVVHMGFALETMTAEEAAETLAEMRELEAPFADQ